jgi:G:T/U-mismatch repair DNA glycosylase
MTWKTNKEEHSWAEKYYQVEDHPYPNYIPEKTIFLVVGSFPSHRKNAAFNFFYGARGNRFWPLLAEVFNRPLVHDEGEPAKEERENLLKDHNIGITDMLSKCYRYKGRSGDDNLYPINFKAMLPLLDAHKSIRRIIFTGRLHIIGPLGLFRTYLHQQGKTLGDLARNQLDTLTGSYDHDGRKVEIMVPMSPSRRFSEDERINYQYLLQRYRPCFERNFIL